MKIVIDCYQYETYVTGTDRQAYHFIDELQKIDNDNSYILLCSIQRYIPNVVRNENFTIRQPWNLSFLPRLVQRIIVKMWREFFLWRLRLRKADVYFCVHNMVLPRFRVARKMIMSNLDIIPIVLPEYFNIGRFSRDKTISRYRAAIKQADVIYSISEYSKRELASFFSVKKEKIVVIPLASDLPKHPKHISTIAGAKLPDKFILTTGGSEPRKNVSKILQAYAKLSSSLKAKYPLIIVGGTWQNHRLQNQNNVIEVGKVDDHELSYLFDHCTLFVWASSYEGFGLPPLEAMAAGAPTICSIGSSLDELCDGKIPQFDPEDTKQITKLMSEYLSSEERLRALSTSGASIAKKYSWSKSTKLLHDLMCA